MQGFILVLQQNSISRLKFLAQFPADSVPTKSQKDGSVSIKAAAWLSPLLHDTSDEGAENEIEVLI